MAQKWKVVLCLQPETCGGVGRGSREMMEERWMETMILGLPSVVRILHTLRSQKDFRQGSDTVHDQLTGVALWKMDWGKPDR